MKKMYVFSLGNPADIEKNKYKYTRHNAARLVCDAFNFDKENVDGFNFIYVVPDCYMNESGKFILDYIKYKNINTDQVVIAYDDIDLSVGEIKLSYARNSGGHNGVESVIQKLNTKDFYRIRIGIGSKPIKEMLLQDYVLSKLKEEEIELFTFKNKNKIEEGGIDLEKKFEDKLDDIKMLIK